MSVFQNKRLRTAAELNSISMRYRRGVGKHPFLLFGLPFMSIIVAASFLLTPVTAVRYEKYDRKVRQMTQEEAVGMHRNARKVNMRDEYYRLAAKDIDNWEQKRVKRLPGESDGEI